MKTAVRVFPLLGALLLPSGCLTASAPHYQRLSSALIGCPPEEIHIAHPVLGSVTSWEAQCRGRQFYCAAFGQKALCTQELPPAAPAPATP